MDETNPEGITNTQEQIATQQTDAFDLKQDEKKDAINAMASAPPLEVKPAIEPPIPDEIAPSYKGRDEIDTMTRNADYLHEYLGSPEYMELSSEKRHALQRLYESYCACLDALRVVAAISN